MIKEAIILAGGLGTRLREAVPDLPKCMAPVNGRPFISYVIDYLRMQGIQNFIFSLGYKAASIEEYLLKEYETLCYKIIIEEEPLGTGGAINKALTRSSEQHVLVTNGDTLFKIDVDLLFKFHLLYRSECTLALKPMQHFDRYGVVETKDGKITSFLEKRFFDEGLINGGVYLIDKEKFMQRQLPLKFSFEKDFLEAFYHEGTFFGMPQDNYFIDIGIPEDFVKANNDLQKPLLNLRAIDESWTLFLDRDGVINDELPGDYVKKKDDFIFCAGALKAFTILAHKFKHIVVVTNQRGIGKGVMSEDDLGTIHTYMQREVENATSKLNNIYYCADVDKKSFFRKPNPGMALQAVKDNPQINFATSIMVGNKLSDMQFGSAAGMFTIFIASTNPDQPFPHPYIDLKFTSLLAFAKAL